ncbi:hypothetical protein CF327_g2035 [Tilletia walkeri]|uniref:J domain-containing protein n=1 Tax=Tilletia walkeri TaxID=117179 RepID=A0A8X7NA30_9BASI|nr:hypothetical protein CF327_g2035 [Tilletia walkeri]KAE8269198.1 hypothetical protein A4X09_0g3150 [Tilletia walkeri]
MSAQPSSSSLLTHFKVLGLPPTATESEIKKSYRKLAIKLHPDKNPHLDPELAASRFHPIQLAYDTLLDPAARAVASEAARDEVAREERMAAFSGKRKSAAEELEREEGFAREKRRREGVVREERESKLARLKEEGRRKVEERESAAASAASVGSEVGGGGESTKTRREDLHTAGSVPTASERERAAAGTTSSQDRRPPDNNEDVASRTKANGKTAPVFSFKTFAGFPSTSARTSSGSGVGAPPPKFSFQPGQKDSREPVGR